MQKSNRRFEKILTVLIALAIFAIGIRIGLSQSGNFLKSVVEPGSMVTEASYIIFTDGSTVYARNGTTGEIEFSGSNASQVINNAIGNGGRKVVVAGNITITNTILVKAYTFLDLSGANLTLAANSNCNMINATGWNYKITGGILDGNGNQQSSGSCIMINGGSQRFWIGGGMRIINAKQFGIYLLGSGPLVTQDIGAGTIDGVDIEDSGSHGILAATWSADNEYTNLNLGGNGGDGISLSSSGASIISDSFIWNNGRYGVDLAGANFNLIETCRVDSNTNNGIMMEYGSSNNTVLGNKIFLNNGTGIEIYDTPGYGPTVQNEINGNTLVGNAGGTILIGDTNNDISSNSGYNTEQQSYSYLVYADGTTYYAKNGTTGQIDFSSTNASQVINNAWGNLSNGGHVVFGSGVFQISNTILIPWYSTMEGMGFSTELNFTGTSGYLIAAANQGRANQYITIKNLVILEVSNNTSGIDFTSVNNGLIDHVKMNNIGGIASQKGILLYDNGNGSYFNEIVGCDINGYGYGVDIYSNVNQVIGGRFQNNYLGVQIDSGSQNSIRDADFEGNQYGINSGAPNSINQVFGGYYELNAIQDISIGNPTALLNCYGIPNANMKIGNYGSTTVRIYGKGYQNSGNATVSNNDWIAHGLATTPSVVTLTPRSNATVWVNNRNATHFQVGVSSGTVTVDWHAEV